MANLHQILDTFCGKTITIKQLLGSRKTRLTEESRTAHHRDNQGQFRSDTCCWPELIAKHILAVVLPPNRLSLVYEGVPTNVQTSQGSSLFTRPEVLKTALPAVHRDGPLQPRGQHHGQTVVPLPGIPLVLHSDMQIGLLPRRGYLGHLAGE